MSFDDTNTLEHARQQRGFSVADLCHLASITPQFWYQLISGQRMPSFQLACWLSILLQQPLDSLFNTTIIALKYFSAQDVELFAKKDTKKG